MNEYSSTVPPIPSLSRVTDAGRKRRLTALILAGVLIVGGAGYVAYRLMGTSGSNIFPEGSYGLVTSVGFPLAPAQTIHLESSSLIPLIVEGQGTATLVDLGESAIGEYYLFATEAFGSSNLYRRAPEGTGIEQLTQSATVKFDLSVDPESGFAAYVSAEGPDAEPHVFVYNPIDRTEKDLGAGVAPTILPGGFHVVFRQGDALVSVAIDSGTATELLTVGSDAPFAVDAENLSVAIYNAALGEIQEFSIRNIVSASYESSKPTEFVPISLTYVHGELLQASRGEDSMLTMALDTAKEAISGVDTETYPNLKISVHHD
jgi:hypothetical protein